MTFTVIILVSSYWCSRLMNETTAPMSLLTHDLEVRSSGSPGRQLIGMIHSAGLEVVEPERPIDFARRLRSSDPQNRMVLERLLEWTPIVPEFQLVALVTLAPRLERCAARLGHGRPSDDTVAEVLFHAARALHLTHEIREGGRAPFVLDFAFSRSRCTQRKILRHNVTTEELGNVDVAEPAIDWTTTLTQRLEEAMAAGVINPDEAEVIEMTRWGGCTLSQWSALTGEPYDRLKKRRSRAETRLRRYFAGAGAVQ